MDKMEKQSGRPLGLIIKAITAGWIIDLLRRVNVP
jgi:hypothetical protein